MECDFAHACDGLVKLRSVLPEPWPVPKSDTIGEEDGMVRVLPPEDQLLLMDGASRYHTFCPQTCEKRDLEYTDKFQDICKRKYKTLMLAWRWLLDVDGVGRVAFPFFCKSAKSIGFREPRRLWNVLNKRQTAFITLDEWDPVSFRNLYEFRCICLGQFGDMETAFNFGMDKTGSRTVTVPELYRFCDEFDFTGDVKVLFAGLDMGLHGFITLDELTFLMVWEGEKFGNRERHFDFQFARLKGRQQAQAAHTAKFGVVERPKMFGLTKSGNWNALLPDVEGSAA